MTILVCRPQVPFVRGGAELVARRFAGVDEPPVNAVGVGFGLATVDAGATTLTPPADPSIPAAALRSSITPDAFRQTRWPRLACGRTRRRMAATAAGKSLAPAATFANDSLRKPEPEVGQVGLRIVLEPPTA